MFFGCHQAVGLMIARSELQRNSR